LQEVHYLPVFSTKTRKEAAMNFESVSVESPRLDPTQESSSGELKRNAAFGDDGRAECEPGVSEGLLKQVMIEIALEKIAAHGLCGGEHVWQYLMDLYRRNCRPNTLRSRFGFVFRLLQYLKAQGLQLLELIGREDICGFIEQEQDRGLSPASVRACVDAVYAFIGFLVNREVLRPELLKRKLQIKVPDSLPRAMDPQDVRKLLSVIRRPRDNAIVLVLLRTGMRIGELLHTTVSDISLAERRIEIFETQKNRIGRVVYLADDACQALAHWLEVRRWQTSLIFIGHGGRPLSYEVVRSMFKRLLEQAGLAHKGYTLHCLRHTFASELLNAGMRLECLQPLLGHSQIEMTRRYARLTDVTRKEEYFRAMAKIEKDGVHGDYRCDYQLPQIS
jgi:site-specific recombinase XerD